MCIDLDDQTLTRVGARYDLHLGCAVAHVFRPTTRPRPALSEEVLCLRIDSCYELGGGTHDQRDSRYKNAKS